MVLEALSPRERLAFVLHDMFGVPFAEIAAILESDARRGPADGQPRAPACPQRPGRRPDLARQRELVDAFLAAAREGDFDALVAVLHPDVVFRQDVGDDRPARAPIVGAHAVARAAVEQGRPFAALARPAVVNGAAGIVVATGDRVLGVCGITVSGDRIAELDLVIDPEKLRDVRT